MTEGNDAFDTSDAEEDLASIAAGEDPGEDDAELNELAEADPEAASDATEADPAKPDRKKTKIPFNVFDAERHRRIAAETKARELQEQFSRGDERLRVLTEAIQQQRQPAAPQVEQDPEPDPNVDVFEHNKWLSRQFQKERGERQRIEQGLQQREYHGRVASAVDQAEQAARAAVPDYDAAVHHLKQSRFTELTRQGIEPRQAEHILGQEALQLAQNALQAGRNPAQVAYEMAMARGYTPKQARAAAKEAEEAVDEEAGVDGDGMPRAANGQFVAQKSAQVEQARAAQAKHKSLSSAGGGSAAIAIRSMNDLANMDQASFNKLKDEDLYKILRGGSAKNNSSIF